MSEAVHDAEKGDALDGVGPLSRTARKRINSKDKG